jgi:hypothetical protein
MEVGKALAGNRNNLPADLMFQDEARFGRKPEPEVCRSPSPPVHVNMDNCRVREKRDELLAASPGTRFRYTPSSVSWPYTVENRSGTMSGKALRGGSLKARRSRRRRSGTTAKPAVLMPSHLSGENGKRRASRLGDTLRISRG